MRRKPDALKKLQGTFNVTRAKATQFEPQPEADLDPVPPAFLTPSQKEGWAYVMRYAPRGLLKALDRSMLVLWVEAEDRHRTAMLTQAKLDMRNKLPMLTTTKAGVAISPYVKIMNHAAVVMTRCCAELGFSPASRPRIQLVPERGPAVIDGEADPWDELVEELA